MIKDHGDLAGKGYALPEMTAFKKAEQVVKKDRLPLLKAGFFREDPASVDQAFIQRLTQGREAEDDQGQIRCSGNDRFVGGMCLEGFALGAVRLAKNQGGRIREAAAVPDPSVQEVPVNSLILAWYLLQGISQPKAGPAVRFRK